MIQALIAIKKVLVLVLINSDCNHQISKQTVICLLAGRLRC